MQTCMAQRGPPLKHPPVLFGGAQTQASSLNAVKHEVNQIPSSFIRHHPAILYQNLMSRYYTFPFFKVITRNPADKQK